MKETVLQNQLLATKIFHLTGFVLYASMILDAKAVSTEV
jgi:hypothetical protein